MDYQTYARSLVVDSFNENLNSSDLGKEIDLDEVYVVWFTYTLGNWKAMVSTTVPDNKYYEVTYDKANECTYVDTYVKLSNVIVPDDKIAKLREKFS